MAAAGRHQRRAELPAPHYAAISFEAERAVLAALMTKPGATAEILSSIGIDDFTTQDHKSIFAICGELYVKQLPLDIVNISIELRKQGRELPVRDIFTNEFTGNWQSHVRALRDVTRRRLALEKIEEARAKIASSEDPDEIIAGVVGDLIQTSMAKDKVKKPLSMERVTVLAMKRIEGAIQRKGTISGIPTGFIEFDAKYGGMHTGDVWVLGARPGEGKSVLLKDIAINASNRGFVCMIANAEMNVFDIGTRMLAGETGIENFELRKGNVDDDQVKLLVNASARLSKLPIFAYDERRWSVIKTQIMALKRVNKNLRLVLVDYLQKLRIDLMPDEQRYQALGRVVEESKVLADELGLAFIIAAQINRKVDNEKRAPTLADLRESGDVEAHADGVAFLHRFDKKDRSKPVYWLVEKNRHGPIGQTKLRFVEHEVKFYDWTGYDL